MNLTDEQLELAAEAAFLSFHPTDNWKRTTAMKQPYREAVRAAAGFLKAPLDVPTGYEISAFQGRLNDHDRFVRSEVLKEVLGKFIAERNRAMQPVDPRREKVAAAIRDIKDNEAKKRFGTPVISPEEISDRILAALDAKE